MIGNYNYGKMAKKCKKTYIPPFYERGERPVLTGERGDPARMMELEGPGTEHMLITNLICSIFHNMPNTQGKAILTLANYLDEAMRRIEELEAEVRALRGST